MKPGKPGGGGPLAALKDRRVQLAAAGAAVLGLIVLFKRGGEPAGAAIQPAATLDSSGTDLANALSNFGDQLSDIKDLLGQQPSGGTGSDPGKGTPKPPAPPATPPKAGTNPPKPGPRPGPKPAKNYVWSTKYTKTNTSWASTLSGIAKHYGTTVSAIMKLNPGIKNPDKIGVHQYIRFR